MKVEEAIKRAVDGGWKPFEADFLDPDENPRGERTPKVKEVFVEDGYDFDIREDVVHFRFDEEESGWEKEDLAYPLLNSWLDPSFWRSLAKAMGWGDPDEIPTGEINNPICPAWLEKWHRFIDHLAEGKTAEEFFKELPI